MSGLGFLLLGVVLAVSLATNAAAFFFLWSWVTLFRRCPTCAFTAWFGRMMQGEGVGWDDDGRAVILDGHGAPRPHGPKCGDLGKARLP